MLMDTIQETNEAAVSVKLTPEQKLAAKELKAAERVKAKEAKAAAKAAAPKVPRTKFALDAVITVKTEEGKNPKKAGSKAFNSFVLYKTGMTVKEYMDAGGNDPSGNMNYDVAKGFITIG